MNRLRKLTYLVLVLVAIAAVAEQLQRAPADRTWTGKVVGIPYDFRVPTVDRAIDRWWNPDDHHLLVPQIFGVGWTVNLAEARRLVMDLLG